MKKLLLIVLILLACEEEPTASNSETYSFNLSVVGSKKFSSLCLDKIGHNSLNDLCPTYIFLFLYTTYF